MTTPKYTPVLNVVLYQPEIPYNTGSVGRTCVAMGAKLWLVRPLGFRIDDYHLRRAGLDYWQHLEWEVVDHLEQLQEKLPNRRVWMFSKTGKKTYTEISYEQGDILMFGCETQGLPKSMLEEQAKRSVVIPIRDEVRSLNLSNSVAIVCYEAIRQSGGGV